MRLRRPISTPLLDRDLDIDILIRQQRDEIGRKGRRGAAGGGIFVDIVKRREHARPDLPGRLQRSCIEEQAEAVFLGLVARIRCMEGRHIRPCRRKCRDITDFRDREGQADGKPDWPMGARDDGFRCERCAGSDRPDVDFRAGRQAARHDDTGACDFAFLPRHSRLDEARFFLEAQDIAGYTAEDFLLSAEHEGGADVRVTCKGDLHRWREDPDLGGVGGVARRQHEGDLRIAELGRDRLHLLVAQAPGIRDDRELVAGETLSGKDVDSDVGDGLWRGG